MRSLAVGWLFTVCSVAFAAKPWDEPFAHSTAEIAKAAAAVPAGDAGAVLLLEDYRFDIQKNGQTVSIFRRVYRVSAASAVDDWGDVEQQWEPWHESRPELRARVISSDGTVHWLDQKTIAESPVTQYDSTIFSDAKVLRAPLPGVAEGAVVEYEIVKRETAPLLAAGVLREITLNPALDLERFHFSINAAKGVTLRTGSNGMSSAAIRQTESKAGTHVEVELGRREADKDFEYSVPRDEPQLPSFRFSTGVSWQAVASAYEQIVLQQTSGANAKSVFHDLGMDDVPRFASPYEAMEKLTAQLHRSIRYTGVEFGQAAIVPNPPLDVINRHYGDCKDKATLLMTMLRSAGLDAHVALLRVDGAEDVDPALPGFGLFDHAIVFVGGERPLWIDATADGTRVGTLPIGDQGRLALVIDGSTTALTKTPVGTAADNRILHNVEIRLNDNGKGSIHESLEASGSFESQMRSMFGGNDREVHTALERFAKTSFSADSIGDFQITKKGDFSQPFRMAVQAKNSGFVVTELLDAAVRVSNELLFQNLPFGLLARGEGQQKTRKHDFVIDAPYHAELHVTIYPPTDFRPNQLPPAEHFDEHGAKYSVAVKQNADGTIQMNYQFELTATLLTPTEFESLRADLKKYAGGEGQLIAFTYKGAELIAIGKTGEALQMAQRSAQEHPDNALAQMRFSQLLLAGGAGNAAVETARQAVKLDGKSALAWMNLAFAYERDSFGRLRVGDWNPAEAEKALRKAIELDASDLRIQTELAILLEYDAAGERYGTDARVAEAVNLYREILKKSADTNVSKNLAFALAHLGRYAEAQQEIRKVGEQESLNIALIALTGTPDTAILQNQNYFPDVSERFQNLAQAGMILNGLRKYEEGAELWRAAQRLNNDGQIAQMLRLYGTTRPYQSKLVADDDLRAPVQRFLLLAAKNASTPEEMAAIISKHADIGSWQAELERTRTYLGMLRFKLRSIEMGTGVMSDLLISNCKITVADDGSANRAPQSGKNGVIVVGVSPIGTAAGHPKPMALVTVQSQFMLGMLQFFVVREDGGPKLLATSDGLESIGRLALDALAKGDLGAAQDWLDAVKNNALPESPRDDKGPAIRYLWAGTAHETRNATFAKAAAASLLGTYGGSAEAVSILKQISEHPAPYMEREDLNLAICEALQKARNWRDLRAASEGLLKSRSYQESGIQFLGEALIGSGDWPELAKTAEARLAVSPKDHNALQFAAIAAMVRGDFGAADKFLVRSKAVFFPGYLSDDLLDAWCAILAGKVSDEVISALDNGNEASIFTKGAEYAYTLALAELRGGKADECYRTLTTAVGTDQADPGGLAWLVKGELLKHYSLDTAANTAFQRARESTRFEHLGFAKVMLQ